VVERVDAERVIKTVRGMATACGFQAIGGWGEVKYLSLKDAEVDYGNGTVRDKIPLITIT